MADRQARIERKTRETQIELMLKLDEPETPQVNTGLPFLDHMLEAFACHGRFGLTVKAEGDIQVDPHHLMEDTGIVLGRALRESLGEGYAGIERAASFSFPMDGTLSTVALDLCGRPTLVWNVAFGPFPLGNLDPNLFRDFFKGFTDSVQASVHVHTICQDNDHHLTESIMKGLGRALRQAVKPLDIDGSLSTKGMLDV